MITKEMTIGDIIRQYPQAVPVFDRYGLDCYDCQIADYEDLEHGATIHKIDITLLLTELNRLTAP